MSSNLTFGIKKEEKMTEYKKLTNLEGNQINGDLYLKIQEEETKFFDEKISMDRSCSLRQLKSETNFN